MHLYHDQFSENYDFPRVETPSKFLVIASTARCGSHMLGHALQKTNKFGFPLEYANPANLAEWRKRLKIEDFEKVMAEIQRRRTSPNGVFGIKMHYSHINQFGGFDNVARCFPDAYYILLSRKNVLKQAVSLSIASQTGVWIAGQKPVNDNPEYNFYHIDKCLRDTILNNSSWRYTLAANGCNYIEMDFDQIRHTLAQSTKDIANFMDIKINPDEIPEEQVTKNQSHPRNAEWVVRFTSDFNNSYNLLSRNRPSFAMKVKRKVMRIIDG